MLKLHIDDVLTVLCHHASADGVRDDDDFTVLLAYCSSIDTRHYILLQYVIATSTF